MAGFCERAVQGLCYQHHEHHQLLRVDLPIHVAWAAPGWQVHGGTLPALGGLGSAQTGKGQRI